MKEDLLMNERLERENQTRKNHNPGIAITTSLRNNEKNPYFKIYDNKDISKATKVARITFRDGKVLSYSEEGYETWIIPDYEIQTISKMVTKDKWEQIIKNTNLIVFGKQVVPMNLPIVDFATLIYEDNCSPVSLLTKFMDSNHGCKYMEGTVSGEILDLDYYLGMIGHMPVYMCPYYGKENKDKFPYLKIYDNSNVMKSNKMCRISLQGNYIKYGEKTSKKELKLRDDQYMDLIDLLVSDNGFGKFLISDGLDYCQGIGMSAPLDCGLLNKETLS